MTYDALAIFTGKDEDDVFKLGGSESWVLDPANARQCRFAVLYYNARAEHAKAKHEQGKAFMIGKIAGVEPASDLHGRWKVRFSEYALISIPGSWKGWRNPVKYITLKELGVDLTDVSFRKMPPRREETSTAIRESGPIPEAKRTLSKALGVPVESIEIIIRS